MPSGMIIVDGNNRANKVYVDSSGAMSVGVGGTVTVDTNGSSVTAEPEEATFNHSSATIGTTSSQLISSASPNKRIALWIFNVGPGILYFRIGTTAATTNDYPVAAGTPMEFKFVGVSQAFQAIASAANTVVRLISAEI